MSNLEETLQSKHVGRQYSIFLFIHLLLCASFGANTVEKSAVHQITVFCFGSGLPKFQALYILTFFLCHFITDIHIYINKSGIMQLTFKPKMLNYLNIISIFLLKFNKIHNKWYSESLLKRLDTE